MARRSAQAPPRPSLLVPADEAREKIQAQIDEGEKLLGRTANSERELDKLWSEQRLWSDYNRELLTRIFSTSTVADEYSAYSAVGCFSINPSLGQQVESWRSHVEGLLTRLRSVHRRIDLFSQAEQPSDTDNRASTKLGRGVFLVHGHNAHVKETVARFLERLELKVTILHEQPDKGRTVIEKFERDSSVSYAVVLLTGDDVGAAKDNASELKLRARQNVILELGYFLGVLGRSHVCAIVEEGVEIPSDLAGVLYVKFDPDGSWKLKLGAEIKAAGIEIDLNLAV